MAERTLHDRYRLLAASFADAAGGARWRERLGPSFREALDLLAHVLGRDLALAPREIDRDQLGALLTTLLPGRLSGSEPYRQEIVDLLEEFLLHVAAEEGVNRSWEWSSAISEHRDAFVAALKNPKRPVPSASVQHMPDRRPAPKIGRNDPCPCGSGKKYKHCCLRLS